MWRRHFAAPERATTSLFRDMYGRPFLPERRLALTATHPEPAARGSVTMLQLLLRTADQFPGQDFPCLR